ncbi:GerW family sporulation protein [Oceanobacillus sp. Castelsardo]|uniref:GerW family sporulation protein n=1 Tax=Oceanobacillus sp. Castelsardo TaxID=1851204 RepID=UPI00083877B2|nr:GerW family sporulation protein [Oceanobacillus sp. Castelsardo]
MEEHPIQGLMTTAMENLKDMVEANTIVGDPVESPDGSIIIPVSKVGFGFAAGGSEFNSSGGEDSQLPFGGGSGGGVSITPIAFLVLGKNGIKMVHLDQQTHLYEKLLNNAPQVFQKIQEMLKESGLSLPKQKGQKENQQEKPKSENKKEPGEETVSEDKKEKKDENINYDI